MIRGRICFWNRKKTFCSQINEEIELISDVDVLEDGRTRTLEEVGKKFNVTRERIRQIEAKALRKLRHPSRSERLKDFLT